MDTVIRRLGPGDRYAAGRLLDDTVGAGFWHLDDADAELSFVAIDGDGVRGVLLARLAPAAESPDVGEADASALARPAHPVLHVRELAVAPEARRARLASRLLARAEAEAAALGARAAFVYAWLPAGRPEPAAAHLYAAAGYRAGREITGFYAEGSEAAGARCPYCGAPPCRCAARPYLKVLPPG